MDLTPERLKQMFLTAIVPLRRELYVPPDMADVIVEGDDIDEYDKGLLRGPGRGDVLLKDLHAFQDGAHDHTAEQRANVVQPKDFDFFIQEMKLRLQPRANENRSPVRTLDTLLACPLLKGAAQNWAVGGNVACPAKMTPNQVGGLLVAANEQPASLLEAFNRKFTELRAAPRGEDPKLKRLRELMLYAVEARDEIPGDNLLLINEARRTLTLARNAATPASRRASDAMKAVENAEKEALGSGGPPPNPARRVAAQALWDAQYATDQLAFSKLEDTRHHLKRLEDLYEHSFLNGFNPFNGAIARMQAACRWMPLTVDSGTSLNKEVENTVLKALCPNLFKEDGTKKDGLTDEMMPHKFCMRCGCLTGVKAFFKIRDIRGAGGHAAEDLAELEAATGADDYNRIFSQIDAINHWHLVPHEGTLRPADKYEYCGGRTNQLVKIYIMRLFIKTLYDNGIIYDVKTTNPRLRELITRALIFISKIKREEAGDLSRIIDRGLFQSDAARNRAHKLNNDDNLRVAEIYKPGPHLFPELEWVDIDYPVGSILYPPEGGEMGRQEAAVAAARAAEVAAAAATAAEAAAKAERIIAELSREFSERAGAAGTAALVTYEPKRRQMLDEVMQEYEASIRAAASPAILSARQLLTLAEELPFVPIRTATAEEVAMATQMARVVPAIARVVIADSVLKNERASQRRDNELALILVTVREHESIARRRTLQETVRSVDRTKLNAAQRCLSAENEALAKATEARLVAAAAIKEVRGSSHTKVLYNIVRCGEKAAAYQYKYEDRQPAKVKKIWQAAADLLVILADQEVAEDRLGVERNMWKVEYARKRATDAARAVVVEETTMENSVPLAIWATYSPEDIKRQVAAGKRILEKQLAIEFSLFANKLKETLEEVKSSVWQVAVSNATAELWETAATIQDLAITRVRDNNNLHTLFFRITAESVAENRRLAAEARAAGAGAAGATVGVDPTTLSNAQLKTALISMGVSIVGMTERAELIQALRDASSRRLGPGHRGGYKKKKTLRRKQIKKKTMKMRKSRKY
jgi:hypothetical protein